MQSSSYRPTPSLFETTIRELYQINIDSSNGYQQASGRMRSSALAKQFVDIAHERRQQADALQALLLEDAERVSTDLNLVSRIQRTILDWQQVFGTSDLTILKRAFRGESYLQAKYEAALSNFCDRSVSFLLKKQYRRVKAQRLVIEQCLHVLAHVNPKDESH